MSLSWRLLRLRPSVQHYSRSHPNLFSVRSLTSFLQPRSIQGHFFHSHFADSSNPRAQTFRRFSSEPGNVVTDSEPGDSEEIRSAGGTVLERFVRDESVEDVGKLKSVFDSGSIALSVCGIVENQIWGDEVEKQLRDLNLNFSSGVVSDSLERLRTDPMKALMFFRWLEESGLFKHDEKTYNAMAKVLGREDCVDRFWNVVEEMESFEFEMYPSNFEAVLGTFCENGMVGDAVKLYEFAMAGPNNKPSTDFGTLLLKKISMAPEFDVDLFSKVVRVFTENGNELTDSMLKEVLGSLKSVGRIEECLKVLGAWLSIPQGFSKIGDVKKASNCLKKMIESHGAESASFALDTVVDVYCRMNKASIAFKLLCSVGTDKQIKLQHTTYEMLITDLLAQGGFIDAVNVLQIMKDHGFPPNIDQFVTYVSKSGTGEEAAVFLRAMSNQPTSSTLYLRVFEAYFKAGRHNEAHYFLSECPDVMRSNPDVLNLFAAQVVQISPA